MIMFFASLALLVQDVDTVQIEPSVPFQTADERLEERLDRR